MFAKLLLIILTAGAIAAALLVNRQHRIDTAHEITVLHRRLMGHEQTLWRMQAEVAEQIKPNEIRRHIERMGGEWVALPAPPRKRRSADQPDSRLAGQPTIDEDDEFGG
jgi:hypothetical protein